MPGEHVTTVVLNNVVVFKNIFVIHFMCIKVELFLALSYHPQTMNCKPK